jgi:Flp pilus assembly protein TadD
LPKPEDGVDGREALERAWMESRLHKDPRDGLALYNLASLEMMQGEAAKAAALYAQVLAQRPGDVRVLTAEGSALAAAGDWAGAQARLREAVAKDPEDVDAATMPPRRKGYCCGCRRLIRRMPECSGYSR